MWQQVVDNYTKAYLPLDTMWADIDYMDDYKVFTISNVSCGKLSNQVKAIR
ncbi:MAG: TIM-barrel domain-containing protein [Flammeovirgaceae bacterium]